MDAKNRFAKLTAAVAAVTTAALLAGCGGDDGQKKATTNPFASQLPLLQPKKGAKKVELPEGVVARVGDREITMKAYEAAAKHPTAVGVPGQVIDPPDFEKCVAGLEKAQDQRAAALPKGFKGPKPPVLDKDALHDQCERMRDFQVVQVMNELVGAAQVEQGAQAAGVKVSDAELDANLKRQRKAYPTAKAYQAYLRQSGVTEAVLRDRLEVQLLRSKLYAAPSGPTPKVTEAQIKDFYAKNKRIYAGKSLASVHDQVRQSLIATARGQAASDRMVKFNASWKAKTLCRTGYVVPLCANG